MISVLQYFGGDKRTRLGGLVLDALVTEEIELEAEVTMYPVEDGSLISDHVTQGVERLRIAGLISTASVTAFAYAGGGAKIVDAIESLRSMHKARALVTVSTGQMVYRDFAFTSLGATRTNGAEGGNWLEIRADLVKVRRVTLRKAEVPAETARAPAAGRAGATNTPAGRSSPTSSANAAGGAAGAAAGAGQPARVTPLLGLSRELTPRAQAAARSVFGTGLAQ